MRKVFQLVNAQPFAKKENTDRLKRESTYLSLRYNLAQSLRFGSLDMAGIRWSRHASRSHLSAVTFDNQSNHSLLNFLQIKKTQTDRRKQRESTYLSLHYNLAQSLRFGSLDMAGIRWSRCATRSHLSAVTWSITFTSSLLAD